MAKLPIGIQSFEKIRTGGFIYIDKTEYIAQLLQGSSVYFLSRPRRFGKSLLISTMEAYFRGQKELFSGLAIEKTEEKKPEGERWIAYPVITFSLSGGEYQKEEGLSGRLRYTLDRFERDQGIEHIDELDLPTQLQHCIEVAYRLTGRQVVVLVDEYDKPLLENLSVNPEQEERNRALFKGFFSILKDEDAYLKFVFITGVTKFSKVSIFSDLNQLEDISLLPETGAICGITGSELDGQLASAVSGMAEKNHFTVSECRKRLAEMYDGYHFAPDGDGVYNPFSLFTALKQGRFGSYWFSTGTPTFLIQKLQASRFRPVDFDSGVRVTEHALENYRADIPDPVPLFYQSGYLTITGYDVRFRQYMLAFPNREVRDGFVESIYPYCFNQSESYGVFETDRFVYDLDHGDVDGFMTRLQSLLASVNYPEGTAPYSEHDFQSNLFIIFCMLGQVVRTEVHTAIGRTDCEIEDGEMVYLFEFKVDRSAEEALSQINDRKYAQRYDSSGKAIFKIGVNFNTNERNISEWKVERSGSIAG